MARCEFECYLLQVDECENKKNEQAEGEVRKHLKAVKKCMLPKLHGIYYEVTKFSSSSQQIKQIKMNIVLYVFNFLESRE